MSIGMHICIYNKINQVTDEGGADSRTGNEPPAVATRSLWGRGRWMALSSVQRYTKTFALVRFRCRMSQEAYNRGLALAISASLPSGIQRVVDARSATASRLIPWHSKPTAGTCRVADFVATPTPWASDVVYVGHGPSQLGVLASPWGCPFMHDDACHCNSDGFAEYLFARADIEYFLRPLAGWQNNHTPLL